MDQGIDIKQDQRIAGNTTQNTQDPLHEKTDTVANEIFNQKKRKQNKKRTTLKPWQITLIVVTVVLLIGIGLFFLFRNVINRDNNKSGGDKQNSDNSKDNAGDNGGGQGNDNSSTNNQDNNSSGMPVTATIVTLGGIVILGTIIGGTWYVKTHPNDNDPEESQDTAQHNASNGNGDDNSIGSGAKRKSSSLLASKWSNSKNNNGDKGEEECIPDTIKTNNNKKKVNNDITNSLNSGKNTKQSK